LLSIVINRYKNAIAADRNAKNHNNKDGNKDGRKGTNNQGTN